MPCKTETWFSCGTGVCINDELRCNDYNECWDGSDETETVCQSNYLPIFYLEIYSNCFVLFCFCKLDQIDNVGLKGFRKQ